MIPGAEAPLAGFAAIASGICPQARQTRRAPARFIRKSNPFREDLNNFEAGKKLYHETARPTACKMCHGKRGNGNGRLAVHLDPPPRNFTCAQTMKPIPDGQLFWIIKYGSPGTKMPSHQSNLSDREIWQLIHYIRTLAR